MPGPINYDAELRAAAADLIADFPDVSLADLAAGLERRADVFDGGPAQALALAAELRRQAAAAKP